MNESFCEFLMLSMISVSINAKSQSWGSAIKTFSIGLGRKWQVGFKSLQIQNSYRIHIIWYESYLISYKLYESHDLWKYENDCNVP